MYCNKCGKEIADDSKFCEHCGNKITEINSNNRLIIDKKIILLIVFIMIGIVITCIGVLIYNNDKNFTINSNNTSSQDTKTNVIIKDLLIEENNGYKTFDFTVDDVINAYSMKEEEIFFSKDGAYCEVHSGTTSAILIPDNRILTEQEKYLSEIIIIYEDVSRKVISINTPVTTMQIASFLTDNNMELTDNWGEAVKNQAYENMLLLLNRVNRKFKNIDVLGDVTNSKNIYSSNDIIYGRYKMIEKNIGLIQCVIEEPIGLDLIIRAVDEEEFYNSTINVLLDNSITSMHNGTENIKENNIGENTKQEVNISKTTGIEQAIKDGMLDENFITNGITEEKLKFIYTDGNLQMYYDTWEECLNDAKALKILKQEVEQPKVNKELIEAQKYVGNYKNGFGAILEIEITEDGNIELNRRASLDSTYEETYNSNVDLNKKRQSSQAIILYEEDWGDVQNNYYLYPIGVACEINDFGEMVQTDISKTRIIFESIYDGVNHGSAYYKID